MQQEGLIQQVGAITIMAILGHFLGPSTAILNKKNLIQINIGKYESLWGNRQLFPFHEGTAPDVEGGLLEAELWLPWQF